MQRYTKKQRHSAKRQAKVSKVKKHQAIEAEKKREAYQKKRETLIKKIIFLNWLAKYNNVAQVNYDNLVAKGKSKNRIGTIYHYLNT